MILHSESKCFTDKLTYPTFKSCFYTGFLSKKFSDFRNRAGEGSRFNFLFLTNFLCFGNSYEKLV